jgi:hypothetical protein
VKLSRLYRLHESTQDAEHLQSVMLDAAEEGDPRWQKLVIELAKSLPNYDHTNVEGPHPIQVWPEWVSQGKVKRPDAEGYLQLIVRDGWRPCDYQDIPANAQMAWDDELYPNGSTGANAALKRWEKSLIWCSNGSEAACYASGRLMRETVMLFDDGRWLGTLDFGNDAGRRSEHTRRASQVLRACWPEEMARHWGMD